MCIEVTGEPSKIQAFIEVMKPLGIVEMCRTGVVALERGNGVLKNETPIRCDQTQVSPTPESNF